MELPSELQGWELKISEYGLVFYSEEKGNYGFYQARKVYRNIEGWLGMVADRWGEVNLMWDGCNQGMRKFGKNRKENMSILSKTSSGVVITNRVEGVEPPDLTSQNLDLNELYNSPYPVYISSLEDELLLFLNPAALRSQGRKPSDLSLINSYTLDFEDELQARNRHLRESLKLDEYEYQGLRWYQNEEGIWLRKKMDFLGNFKKVEYLGVECRLSVVLEAVPA